MKLTETLVSPSEAKKLLAPLEGLDGRLNTYTEKLGEVLEQAGLESEDLLLDGNLFLMPSRWNVDAKKIYGIEATILTELKDGGISRYGLDYSSVKEQFCLLANHETGTYAIIDSAYSMDGKPADIPLEQAVNHIVRTVAIADEFIKKFLKSKGIETKDLDLPELIQFKPENSLNNRQFFQQSPGLS